MATLCRIWMDYKRRGGQFLINTASFQYMYINTLICVFKLVSHVQIYYTILKENAFLSCYIQKLPDLPSLPPFHCKTVKQTLAFHSWSMIPFWRSLEFRYGIFVPGSFQKIAEFVAFPLLSRLPFLAILFWHTLPAFPRQYFLTDPTFPPSSPHSNSDICCLPSLVTSLR